MDQTNLPKRPLPNLFVLCTSSEAIISDCWTVQGWNLYFRRLLNDWEIEIVDKLLEEWGILEAPILTMMLLDGHTVRMGSSQLAGHIKRSATREVADIGVHGKNIWRTAAPTKVKCFTWLVIRKACLTHEVLRKKRNIILPWCSLWGKIG